MDIAQLINEKFSKHNRAQCLCKCFWLKDILHNNETCLKNFTDFSFSEPWHWTWSMANHTYKKLRTDEDDRDHSDVWTHESNTARLSRSICLYLNLFWLRLCPLFICSANVFLSPGEGKEIQECPGEGRVADGQTHAEVRFWTACRWEDNYNWSCWQVHWWLGGLSCASHTIALNLWRKPIK